MNIYTYSGKDSTVIEFVIIPKFEFNKFLAT